MKKLNEMKVAARLLVEMQHSAVLPVEFTALTEIALQLAEAGYLFRDEPVRQIARIVIEAAGMGDLYDDDQEDVMSVGPRPTVWTDAARDEVWELRFDDGTTGAYIFDGASFVGKLRPGGGVTHDPNGGDIVSGRRIWEPRP